MVDITADDGAGEIFRHRPRRTGILHGRVQTATLTYNWSSDMSRDKQLFPDDEIGDALWALQEDGEDLSIEHEVEFAVIFPDEQSALDFAIMLLQNGQKVAYSEYDGNDQLPWQVLAYPVMELSHEHISGYAALLSEHSADLGGQMDGWSAL